MEKTYQVSSGNNKTVSVNAPVIAQMQLSEPQADPVLVSRLIQGETSGEKGLVLRRIGGIAIILLGIPLGLFSLLCFPGLLFWLLGPLALAMIAGGIYLMFSRRSKDPQEAFKMLFKEAYFNADATAVVFSSQLFKSPELIKKRIHAMLPLAGLSINDSELINFMNTFGHRVRTTFKQYGGAEEEGCTYAIFVDPLVHTCAQQGPVTTVQGSVNVIRQNGASAQIIEVQIRMNLLLVGGFQMPVNLVPHFFDTFIQTPVFDPGKAWTSPVATQAQVEV